MKLIKIKAGVPRIGVTEFQDPYMSEPRIRQIM